MFTGIVTNVGTVNRIVQRNEGAELTVHAGEGFERFEVGESISVNGVCLTVRDISKETFTVDLSSETLSRTSFKSIEEQTSVNLERSLTPSDKISGHFVSGHVDCVGHVTSIERKTGETIFRFDHPAEYDTHIIEKGSVAIDGISLTAFSCFNNGFSVSIIPSTFSHTNMKTRKMRDAIITTDTMIIVGIFEEEKTSPLCPAVSLFFFHTSARFSLSIDVWCIWRK